MGGFGVLLLQDVSILLKSSVWGKLTNLCRKLFPCRNLTSAISEAKNRTISPLVRFKLSTVRPTAECVDRLRCGGSAIPKLFSLICQLGVWIKIILIQSAYIVPPNRWLEITWNAIKSPHFQQTIKRTPIWLHRVMIRFDRSQLDSYYLLLSDWWCTLAFIRIFLFDRWNSDLSLFDFRNPASS